METRKMDVTLETAKRWYEVGGEMRDMALSLYSYEELRGTGLPKSWGEYWKSEGEKGTKMMVACESIYEYARLNLFDDYNEAVKHCCMIKLHILRDIYRNGWKPDWNDESIKYCIIPQDCSCKIALRTFESYFLSFRSKKVAEEFMKNFMGLIIEAGDLV